MRAGKLDRLIDIQRKSVTPGEGGEPVETWANIAARRPAGYRPLRGDERFGDPQLVANEQVEFRIHYSLSVAALTPQDRIIYPAMSADSPPEDITTMRIHDILAVQEIGRREGLQIITRRRADVTS